MSVALNTYNNFVAERTWIKTKNSSASNEDPKLLALAAQLDEIKKSLDGNNARTNSDKAQVRTGWRYQNPDNKTELICNDKTYKWCNKDCHPCEQWCDRPVCRNRADYNKSMEAKKKRKDTEDKAPESSNSAFSDAFKVALSAITTASDFKTLENSFSGRRGIRERY